MAKQIRLSDGSHVVFGGPGSGKTHWCLENFLANPSHALYIDFNKAGYRAMAKGEVQDIRQDHWYRGYWGKCKKPILLALAREPHKALWSPSSGEEVQKMADFFRDFKERRLEDTTPIFIYCDEADLYGDLKSSAEQMTTKDRGAGIRPVSIVQRPGQVRNRNIVGNVNGGALIFRVETGEANILRRDYGLEFSDEDLQYIQSVPYAAIYCDYTKFPRAWVRL